MPILKEILYNFAEDELLSFLPRSAINFALSSSEVNEEDLGVSKHTLAELISATKGSEFIFNEELRTNLIERIPPSVFTDMFPEIAASKAHVTPAHYSAAIKWANLDIQGFAAKIGLSEDYELNTQASDEFESIARITPSYSLYPYQEDISSRIFSNFEAGATRQLIHLPTGSGKTRTAMNIASQHLRDDKSNLVLWLADREELCSQAFREFKAAWESLGSRPTSVYGFYSESDESLSGIDSGFVVAGLHKFLSIRKRDSKQLKILYKQLLEKVTLVIFDEAHKAIAPKFREVVEDFIGSENFNANLIGLTATPGRKFSLDGLSDEDKVLSSFFHENKVSMRVSGYLSPIDYLVEEQYLAKAEFKSLNYDHSKIQAYELSDSGGPNTMKALAVNTERNSRIMDTIKKECADGAFVIVFACTVEHAVNLATALSFAGIKAASIDSKNDTPQTRRAKINQYKQGNLQVLVNFNVLTAGFDAPRTSVAVIAKPMDSLVQYLQMAGRAMRGFKSGGNNQCRIYTVMDDIPQFKSINLAFEHWNEMWQEG